jgi:hypothetical protein
MSIYLFADETANLQHKRKPPATVAFVRPAGRPRKIAGTTFKAPAMSIFRRPDYRSETTGFIDQLKAAKPSLEAEQRSGRALLWDQQVDREAQAEYRDARVDQQPYVYQTSGT